MLLYLAIAFVIGGLLGAYITTCVIRTREESLIAQNNSLRRENVRYKDGYNKYLNDISVQLSRNQISNERAEELLRKFTEEKDLSEQYAKFIDAESLTGKRNSPRN